MNKLIIFLLVCAVIITNVALVKHGNDPEHRIYIPASEQQQGDSTEGYNYLVTGDYIKSGIAYNYWKLLSKIDTNNYLNRAGKNATLPYNYTVVQSSNGTEVVVPNCLQCHAQEFDGKLIIGLGNSTVDFTTMKQSSAFYVRLAANTMKLLTPKQYEAAGVLTRSYKQVFPYMQTEVQGVNAADRLAALLVAHRDPQTLEWSDSALLTVPDEVVPTDVPAWWLLKKKHAMFYNGFGRGDFSKFLMASNILTTKDSAEANEVSLHFSNVLAYIQSIQSPKYPKAINQNLAEEGEDIFINNCSSCHGTYGNTSSYPNYLIPEHIIQTDSLLLKSNYQNPQFIDWFNKSWFATSDHPAKLVPSNGYVAPPLDGVWVTAPYLHNGSVPTLQALLNSKERPTYWERNFKKLTYDYDKVGWQYEVKDKAGNKKIYNTTLPGYGNYGHTFGDKLTPHQRKAVIEYLKTL